jgi:hypothetical protein
MTCQRLVLSEGILFQLIMTRCRRCERVRPWRGDSATIGLGTHNRLDKQAARSYPQAQLRARLRARTVSATTPALRIVTCRITVNRSLALIATWVRPLQAYYFREVQVVCSAGILPCRPRAVQAFLDHASLIGVTFVDYCVLVTLWSMAVLLNSLFFSQSTLVVNASGLLPVWRKNRRRPRDALRQGLDSAVWHGLPFGSLTELSGLVLSDLKVQL